MKANELRIGNWVIGHLTGRYLQVDWLAMKHMWDGNIQSVYNPQIPVYNPILLTPEILEKCGVEEIYKSPMHTTFYLHGISYYFWHELGKQYAEISGKHYEHIQYLHQFQNVIFDLTNTELPITL
jgi:hypothetical protein